MQIHASLNSAVGFASTLAIAAVNYLDLGQVQIK